MFHETFVAVQICRKFMLLFLFCFLVMEHCYSMFHETFVAVQICRKLVKKKKIRQV